MLIEALQTLFDYNTWANGRIFDEASHLSPGQFTSTTESLNLSSIHEILFHLVTAQHTWLARCQEVASPEVKIILFPDYLKLRRYWEKVDQETHNFLRTLDVLSLQHTIYYANPQGEANAYSLWHLLYHQINHAGQHRSEVAVLLTSFDHSPGWLDFLYYLDLRDGTTLHL